MGRSVVLHLLARLEVVLAGRHGGRLPDALPATEGGQGLVRELGSAGEELFMDSHQIPLATGEQLQDLLPVGLGFLGAAEFRHLGGIRTHNLADRETGEA